MVRSGRRCNIRTANPGREDQTPHCANAVSGQTRHRRPHQTVPATTTTTTTTATTTTTNTVSSSMEQRWSVEVKPYIHNRRWRDRATRATHRNLSSLVVPRGTGFAALGSSRPGPQAPYPAPASTTLEGRTPLRWGERCPARLQEPASFVIVTKVAERAKRRVRRAFQRRTYRTLPPGKT